MFLHIPFVIKASKPQVCTQGEKTAEKLESLDALKSKFSSDSKGNFF